MQLGRDDLAREALSRKAAAQQQVDALEPQHQQLSEQQEKMTETLQALQTRVNQFRTQKESLKAQYSAAQATSMVNDQIAGIQGLFMIPAMPCSEHKTKSLPLKPTPGRWTNCSSRACSRTSGLTTATTSPSS